MTRDHRNSRPRDPDFRSCGHPKNLASDHRNLVKVVEVVEVVEVSNLDENNHGRRRGGLIHGRGVHCGSVVSRRHDVRRARYDPRGGPILHVYPAVWPLEYMKQLKYS